MKLRYESELLTLVIEEFDDLYSSKYYEMRSYIKKFCRGLSADQPVKRVILPDDCDGIPSGLFEDFVDLERIDIPETVTWIGENAFRGCKSLRSIDLPDEMDTIGVRAFESSGLKAIDWPTGVDTVQDQTFMDCRNLVHFVHEKPIKTIGYWAFSGCASLTTKILNVEEDINPWAFECCISLDEMKISARALHEGAFSCAGLRKVTLTDCRYINSRCFGNCPLTDLDIYDKPLAKRSNSNRQFETYSLLKEIRVHTDVAESPVNFPMATQISTKYFIDNKSGLEIKEEYIAELHTAARDSKNQFLLCFKDLAGNNYEIDAKTTPNLADVKKKLAKIVDSSSFDLLGSVIWFK